MKKSFLKPFAVTAGAMIVGSAANATVSPIDFQTTSIISSVSSKIAGADVTLQHISGNVELAAHGSHSSHSSHASHSSHSSHASSAY
jgi:hypothetical protein